MHPVAKTMRWIKKWMTPLMMGTTSSITMQSLGKIAQCRCRCENMVCFFVIWSRSESVTYLLTYRAFEGCIVRTSIALPFIARFRCSLQRFFDRWFLFQRHYIFLIFVARWCRNFHEIAVKNCEKSQNRRKTTASYAPNKEN